RSAERAAASRCPASKGSRVNTKTESPRSSNARTTARPTKPVPPVTATLLRFFSLPCFLGVDSTAQTFYQEKEPGRRIPPPTYPTSSEKAMSTQSVSSGHFATPAPQPTKSLGKLSALLVLVAAGAGCSKGPAAPFDTLKGSNVVAFRLQNYEPPPQAAATPGPAVLIPGL